MEIKVTYKFVVHWWQKAWLLCVVVPIVILAHFFQWLDSKSICYRMSRYLFAKYDTIVEILRSVILKRLKMVEIKQLAEK